MAACTGLVWNSTARFLSLIEFRFALLVSDTCQVRLARRNQRRLLFASTISDIGSKRPVILEFSL